MKPNKDPLKNEEERKDRSRSSYSELPEDDDSSPTKVNKKEQKKATKETREIRILKRSKTLKEKNDPERFCGDGVNFKAKIIGIEHVFDARGNRMCQGALQRLKAAVKTSGDHKQKITLNISLCGIKIKDEKTMEVLHHHPIHKISFISQDTSDSRAFGYVFGCPQSGHRFFGIKTEKTASQVVMTLRDLFHSALEMKKQEMERAMEISKDTEDQTEQDTHKNGGSEAHFNGTADCASANGAFGDSTCTKSERERDIPQELLYLNTVMLPEENEVPRTSEKPSNEIPSAVDDLLDLQIEMDSLQQGITQMECSIATAAAHGFAFSFSEDEVSVSSGSSFPMTPRKIDRLSSLYQETLSMSSRSSSTSDYNACSQEMKSEEQDSTIRNNVCSSDQSPPTVPNEDPPSPSPEPEPEAPPQLEAQPEPVEDRYAVFLDIDSLPSIFDSPIVVNTGSSGEFSDNVHSSSGSNLNFDSSLESNTQISKTSTPVVFAELDPLGDHPFVDRKNFFQDIKNPPKKVLKDFAENSSEFSDSFPECDGPPSYAESSVPDGKLFNPFIPDVLAYPHAPPKLPPKRSASIASPLTFIPAMTNDEEHAIMECAPTWEVKNPFNPFVGGEDFEEFPPPSSPPPPPPPRLPMKSNEPPPMSPPPPRPPSRSNGVPTPPLPKRKPPLTHSSKAWFSFDQEAISLSCATQTQEFDTSPDFFAPPIPAPSRRLPPTTSKFDSAIMKSSSASNSPATARKLLNQSPHFGASSLTKENSEITKLCNGVPCSPRKILSRHSSIAQERSSPEVGFSNQFFESDFGKEPTIADYAEAIEALNRSPPLPPKPSSIARPRPSPSKKMLSTPSTASRSSSNVSTTETTNGTCSSSSFVYSSVEESKHGSGSEGLLMSSTGSQSEVVPFCSSNGFVDVKSSAMSPVSPDSIFQRKDDPFADDFFLSLPRKSSGANEACAIDHTLQKHSNGGVHLEHL